MKRLRFYDEKKGILVYIDNAATSDFWDNWWDGKDLKERVVAGSNFSNLHRVIKRFLGTGNYKLLDGGSGIGNIVYAFDHRGYEGYGVDYALKTNEAVRSLFPDLNIVDGDVTDLPFDKDFFDGYYSGGVIEHFYFGYDQVLQEMHRVLKPGGYAFVTFPHMSPLRKFMGKIGHYQYWNSKLFDEKTFYQFALDPKVVIRDFCALGFSCLYKKAQSGAYGIEDDLPVLGPLIKKLLSSKYKYVRAIAYAIGEFFRPFAGHAMLLVLQKTK